LKPATTPSFYINNLPIYGDLILAPMDGFSDLPFRSICREMGSAMSYTEFISAVNVSQQEELNPAIIRKLSYLPEERPVVYQLFDNDPDSLLEAALRLQERGPDVIDINMGCSVRSVSGRGAGAGLLRSPIKIAHIFRKLSQALEVPITGKIRLGWDEEARNYLLVARIIEENGGALVAVHARTRAQGYSGEADWEAIAEVKQAISIPVIGNGDVRTVSDIDLRSLPNKFVIPCFVILNGCSSSTRVIMGWFYSESMPAAISNRAFYQQNKEGIFSPHNNLTSFYPCWMRFT
jgi:tRNA-dihydrouridine synthase B